MKQDDQEPQEPANPHTSPADGSPEASGSAVAPRPPLLMWQPSPEDMIQFLRTQNLPPEKMAQREDWYQWLARIDPAEYKVEEQTDLIKLTRLLRRYLKERASASESTNRPPTSMDSPS